MLLTNDEFLVEFRVDISIYLQYVEIQNGDNIGGIATSDGTAKLEPDSHNKDGLLKAMHMYLKF